MSAQARSELNQLQAIISTTNLSDGNDKRKGPFCLPCGKLDSGSLYRLLQSKAAPSLPAAKFIWESRAPPRVQFFVWLLIQGRVQCRVNLHRKSIVDSLVWEVFNQADETAEHIVLDCPFARAFWLRLGFSPAQPNSDERLLSVQCQSHFPTRTFIALCYWNLWKRRYGVVFRDESATLRQVLLLILADAKLWKMRLPKKHRMVADAWCSFVIPLCN